MAIGTAGYTAMLCVIALERHGVTPDSGEILVTGAAGGVGSVAVALLSKLGFHVAAMTGRPAEADFLKQLGALEIIEQTQYAGAGKPLAKPQWRDTAFVERKGGTLTFRSRFLDYTGIFMLHCHMMNHEEMGMMQTVEVYKD